MIGLLPEGMLSGEEEGFGDITRWSTAIQMASGLVDYANASGGVRARSGRTRVQDKRSQMGSMNMII